MVRPVDTAPQAWRRQIEIFRRMSGVERLELACRMSEAARELTLTGIRHRHPEWTEEQVHHALLQQLHGPEVAEAVHSARLARALSDGAVRRPR